MSVVPKLWVEALQGVAKQIWGGHKMFNQIVDKKNNILLLIAINIFEVMLLKYEHFLPGNTVNWIYFGYDLKLSS